MIKTPYKIAVEEGKLYAWCSCGHTQTEPFCNGAHRDHSSEKKSLKFIAKESKEVYLCTCKKTRTPPYCDGSHSD